MKNKVLKIFTVSLIGILCACVPMQRSNLSTQQSQLQMRNYQSRAFDSQSKSIVMKGVVTTMQDLNFIIERADEKLGTVSGTSFNNGSKLTVSVRKMGDGRIVVRANAQSGLRPITEPMAYQNFFNALSQTLFLEAHEVE